MRWPTPAPPSSSCRSRDASKLPQRGPFRGCEAAPFADLEPVERERADAGADELQPPQADRLDHAPHLAVFSLGQDDLEPGVFPPVLQPPDAARPRAVSSLHPDPGRE